MKAKSKSKCNLYGMGMAIIQNGIEIGHIMNRAKAIHDTSDDENIKAICVDVWDKLNRGKMDIETAVWHLDDCLK